MVNWYEKAKLEISKKGDQPTANTDEIGQTAVLAVPGPNDSVILQNSFGSNGSTPVGNLQKIDLVNSLTASHVAISSSQPCIAEGSSSWLKKTKLEISKKGDQPTANTDEIGQTAVLAVSEPGDSVILQNSFVSNGSTPVGNLQKIKPVTPMTANEHAMISLWLTSIGEDDSSIIDHVLSQCRADLDARNYFIQMTSFATKPVSSNDDRRCCTQCTNLTKRGSCLAARRGEIVASRSYEPIPDIPRRCEGYAPKADDLDRRTGRERWFDLIHEGHYTMASENKIQSINPGERVESESTGETASL